MEVTPERLARRVAIGQRADVHIEVGRQDNVLRMPARMVHHDQAGPHVYADRGGRIALVRVKLGAVGGDHVQVLDGLAAGDRVLAAPGSAVALPTGRRWVAP